MEIKEKFCQTKWGKICYWDFGGGDKTLVFVHGFLGLPAHMGKIKDLADKGVRIIAPYLPSHGKSFYISKGFLFLDLVAVFEEFFQQLGLRNVVLVAHSLGGALTLGLEDKKFIKQIILIDPALVTPEINWKKIPGWIKDMYADRDRFKTEAGKILFPQFFVCLKEFFQLPDLLKLLRTIKTKTPEIPAAYLWGEKDAFTPLPEYVKTAKVFPGGHHWFHWQEEKLIAEIEKFL